METVLRGPTTVSFYAVDLEYENRQHINNYFRMKRALKPEDITDLFLEYINAGNIDGILSIYEDNAVLVTDKNNTIAKGKNEIRNFYSSILTNRPTFEKGQQRPAIVNGNLALTSSRLINGFVTAEIARQQRDGSWKWCIDQPIIAIEQNEN